MVETSVFASCSATLGEGPIWHAGRMALLWVDIATNRLFEKSFYSSPDEFNSWALPATGSALAIDNDSNDDIWIITDKGLGTFSLRTGAFRILKELDLPQEMRSNDGAISPDGRFWFGVMKRAPTNCTGRVGSIGPSGDLRWEVESIGIPNSFVWSNDGQTLFLSDSLVQTTYRYRSHGPAESRPQREAFLDLSGLVGTPDGASLDKNGNVWIALWDGYSVGCYCDNGHKISEIVLPIPRPTSCCFGGPNNDVLFITSAREGLSEQQLCRYPHSGDVFSINIGVTGQTTARFQWTGP